MTATDSALHDEVENPMQSTALIEVRNVNKTFATTGGGELVALRDVSLSIERGEFVSLVGPSGCGKSTLLNMIGGLLGPSTGEISFAGREVTKPSRDVGMMFQSPVLLPWRTVLENVMLPIDVFGWKRKKYVDRAHEILDLVGLKGFADAYPAQLSGGMQSRVSLSRVLLYEPDVLLLDEPFGALDEFTREALNLELLRIWEETNKTIVFVTHNIGEAVLLSQRIVVMRPRPGEIADIIDVDLPAHRDREVMRLPEFAKLSFEVRELLGVAS
jgi:NitT/TauT family transport system ATP-binding protein